MNPETLIQLRYQLEAIKEFERKNAPSRFSYAGYWGEFLVGILALGEALIVRPPVNSFIAQWFFFLAGIALTCQGMYLINRFKMDKRVKLLLEAMLSIKQSEQV